MSSVNRTDALLSELDQKDLTVRVDDETASVPTLSCSSDAHNGEPIREGEHAVLILVRENGGEWDVERTFCGHCQVLDYYADMDTTGRATAVVEGLVVPENEYGPSKRAALLDGFLWELNEGQ